MANFGQYRSAADGSTKSYTSAPLMATKAAVPPSVLAGTKALMASTNPQANAQGSAPQSQSMGISGQLQGGQSQQSAKDSPSATLETIQQSIHDAINEVKKA